MNLKFTLKDSIRGGIIYASGDTIAAFILDEFILSRLIGMMIIGASLYAFEIPNYFAWIERKSNSLQGWKKSMFKTGMAMTYFNPLWIARHLLFIRIFSFQLELISFGILWVATLSFIFNIFISLIGNFIIQNLVHLDWRFFASALFSALMAIYYAMSLTWFS